MNFGDFSSNNGVINVAAYTPRRTWISLKRTEGTGYAWTGSDQLVRDAHDHNLHVIHYHFLRPDQAPDAQAAFFLDHSAGVRAGDVFMVDLEATAGTSDPADGARAAQLSTFIHTVHLSRPGMPVLVYTGNWYLDGKPQLTAQVARHPVILADYTLSIWQRRMRRFNNRHRLSVWALQYTDKAKLPGVPGPCDANVWIRKPAGLFRF